MATKPKTGTAVAVKASSNIVSIKDALKAQALAMTGRTAPSTGSAIRTTQDKQFVLPDGTKTPGPLELVIVDFTSKNAFYPGAFDPKNITPPACFVKSWTTPVTGPTATNSRISLANSDCTLFRSSN